MLGNIMPQNLLGRLYTGTNVLVNFEACKNKNTFQSCNIASHYMKDHPSLEAPVYVTTEEIKKLKNLII